VETEAEAGMAMWKGKIKIDLAEISYSGILALAKTVERSVGSIFSRYGNTQEQKESPAHPSFPASSR